MEKRVLLAVVLSFVVLYGYQAMFPPPKPAPPATQVQPDAAAAKPPAEGAAASPQPVEAATLPPSPSAAAVVADTAEREIIVENESVRAIFTTRGGALKSWRLKKYQDAAHQPLELIPQDAPAGHPRPFALLVDDAAT